MEERERENIYGKGKRKEKALPFCLLCASDF